MILLAQAAFFYLPNTFWYLLNSRSGVDLNSLVETAEKMSDGENREKPLRYIVKQLDRFVYAPTLPLKIRRNKIVHTF